MKYSVIIPAYNEQAVLEMSFARLKEVMDILGDYELIFVNDGSRDDTLNILKEIADKDKSVKIISFSRNFGHQAAISAGMSKSRGSAVIIIDCDLQDPPEIIPDMAEKWKNGADIVYGKRIKRQGEKAFKKITAWIYYKVLHALGGQYIPANTGDFRLIDRKVCDALNNMPEKNRFLRGMAAWAGFKSEPQEFIREQRAAGKTKYSAKKMVKLAGDGIMSFSNRPLKLPLYAGILLFMLSIAYLVFSIVLICLGALNYVHILFAIVFCFMSFGLISLGIFGLYLGKIYDEAKQRPLYIINEQINF